LKIKSRRVGKGNAIENNEKRMRKEEEKAEV
jgi:hypothetical protein